MQDMSGKHGPRDYFSFRSPSLRLSLRMRNRPGPIGCYSRSCQYPIAPVREGEAAACVSHEGGKAGPQAEDGNSIGKDGGNYTWPGRSVSQENFCPCEGKITHGSKRVFLNFVYGCGVAGARAQFSVQSHVDKQSHDSPWRPSRNRGIPLRANTNAIHWTIQSMLGSRV